MYIKRVKLGLEQWIELFLNHYRYWDNYKSNSVLVDSSLNLIWFWDNGENEVFVLQIDTDYNYKQIIANWKIIDFKPFKFNYWNSKEFLKLQKHKKQRNL